MTTAAVTSPQITPNAARDVQDLEKAENEGNQVLKDAMSALGTPNPDALAARLKGLKFDANGNASVKLADGTTAKAHKAADGTISLTVGNNEVALDASGGFSLKTSNGAKWSMAKIDDKTWERSAELPNGAESSILVKKNADGTFSATATEQVGTPKGQGQGTATVATATSANPWTALDLADDAVDYSASTGRAATISEFLPNDEPVPNNSFLKSSVSNKKDGTAVTEGQVSGKDRTGVYAHNGEQITTTGDNALRDGLLQQTENLEDATSQFASEAAQEGISPHDTQRTDGLAEAADFHTRWAEAGGQGGSREAEALAWQRSLATGRAPTQADVEKARADLTAAQQSAGTGATPSTSTSTGTYRDFQTKSANAVRDAGQAILTKKGSDFNKALTSYTETLAKQYGGDPKDQQFQYKAAKLFSQELQKSFASSMSPEDMKEINDFLLSVVEQQGVQAFDEAANSTPPDVNAQNGIARDVAQTQSQYSGGTYRLGDATNVGLYFTRGGSEAKNSATFAAWQKAVGGRAGA